MPTPKPKAMKTPFEQTQTSTYAPMSIAGTPEAQAYLDVPLDYDVDPGVARRTDLAEQEAENRASSVFGGGVPGFFRQQSLARELRGIRGQGAAEAQQAQFMAKNARTAAELERRRMLLPNILQTGGRSSGYGTQIVQPQPGFLHQAGLSLIGGARNAAMMYAGGGMG